MSVTDFSVGMSVLFSSLFIVLIHLLRGRVSFPKTFGAHTILLLYFICAFRMCCVVETPHTVPISIGGACSGFIHTAASMRIPVAGREIGLAEIGIAIWLIGFLASLAWFLRETFSLARHMRRFPGKRSRTAEQILETVKGESGRKYEIGVCVYPNVVVPMGIGVMRKRIILPQTEYTQEELYHILKHEYTHFVNHDLVVKQLTRTFCCVFWWNPLAYLLKKDVDQILEIKCDLVATKDFSNKKRVQYLSVLAKSLKEAVRAENAFKPPMRTQLLDGKYRDQVKERVSLLIEPPKGVSLAMQIAVVSFALLMLIFSYSFVLQTAYDPRSEDIYTHESVRESTSPNEYILKHKDGTYSAVTVDGFTYPLKESTVKVFVEIEKLEVREE